MPVLAHVCNRVVTGLSGFGQLGAYADGPVLARSAHLLPLVHLPREEFTSLTKAAEFTAPGAHQLAKLRDRAIGALVGLAVGDALGTTLEFKARDTYQPLTTMVGGGPFDLNPGEWTDDTSMALALADSLQAHPELDPADLMTRLIAWRDRGDYSCVRRCIDIGWTVDRALDRWLQTGDPMAGSFDPTTAGNGSLMRLAPVVLVHWPDRAKIADVAARQLGNKSFQR